MKLLFIFLDGVGLGENNPNINPFVRALTPNLDKLLDGQKIIANGDISSKGTDLIKLNTNRASLLALDACLGIDGVPQSATGQASLLTGLNVPAFLGYHDGPKPSPAIIELINKGTIFSRLHQHGKTASLLNAFPPGYFDSIKSGKRIPGVIALAVNQAGIELRTMAELFNGNAISTDFTAQGWRDHLGFPNTPLLSLAQAAHRIDMLSDQTDLGIFEFWLTDMAGHHQDMQSACTLLESIDTILGSLLNEWDYQNKLILITSDHGNLEDLSTRHHTRNDVPLLLIGSGELRRLFIARLNESRAPIEKLDLTDIAPAIQKFIG